jgi:hypothetical protein
LIITEKFIGEVVENNDSQKLGRVQINIPEIFLGNIPNGDLPWAKQDRASSSDIPEIGDKVWCYWHDEINFRNLYYGNKVDLFGYTDHGKFESEIKSKLSGFSSSYPDVKFKYLANGNCIGMTSGDNPEIFIVHKDGSQVYIKSNGDISIKDKSGHEIELDSTGITLNTGDASSWKPNSLGIDPFTGVPHFQSIKLKGA